MSVGEAVGRAGFQGKIMSLASDTSGLRCLFSTHGGI